MPPTAPISNVTMQKPPVIDIAPCPSMAERQALPQHPKMTLSYILNPAAPAMSHEIKRHSRSPSPLSSSTDFATESPTSLQHTLISSVPDIPSISLEPVPNSPLSMNCPTSPSSSPSSSPFLSRFERLPPPLFVPDFSFDHLPYSLIYESADSPEAASRNLADIRFRSVRVQCPIRPPSVDEPSPSNGSDSRCTSPLSSIDLHHNPDTPEDEIILASPITTPPSSPPLSADRDTFDIVEPPQMLSWEGPPPPGLTERNHAGYQRAGVHWMLAQIFGSEGS
ncbi:hypothetical protein Clacol_006996 [Clathrus columnatus]|uniref:Uncharacterized protein n=1 Tax=Clathrus columnatus TaxID=1419009 RepID=A0AAV5ADP9_9AGAM|nr:hypothetical protein Clacol_006996 [Clathrus columnatus]